MDQLKAQLRTAVKLDDQSLKAVAKFVKAKHGLDCQLVTKLAPELIAGFKLNVLGVEYDYSLAGSLDRLEQAL